MKKTIAMLMTLALLVSALAVPALAEETAGTTEAVTSATTQVTGKGGQNRMPGQNNRNDRMPGNGQMPQTPGQNNQNGQMPGNGQMPQMPGQNSRNDQMPGNGQIPQMPGQDSQDSQTPQLPDQNSQGDQNTQDNQTPQLPDQNSQDDQNTQTSQKPGHGMKHGRQGKGADGQNGKQMIFDQLLKDGVITQEVYDAITAWLQQNMPQAQQDTASDGGKQAPTEGTEPPALPDGTAPAEGSEPPALPDGTAPAEGSEPPALPDGTAPAEGSEPPALPENAPDESVNPMEEMLKSLLDSGVITQEQYDLLLTAIQSLPQPSAAPDAPSET